MRIVLCLAFVALTIGALLYRASAEPGNANARRTHVSRSSKRDFWRSSHHARHDYPLCVSTADGKVRDFWKRNLRFKTDVSEDGQQKGALALALAGMMGDRADVILPTRGD